MSTTINSHFDLLDLDCAERFEHNGIEVTVVHREKINEATGRALEMCATSDAGQAGRDWHEGPQTGQPVYYVLVTPTRIFHGWLDSESRDVVQTG